MSVAPAVMTQNPAGGEEPGEMPRAGAVQQLFVFNLDHPSRWKSCCERGIDMRKLLNAARAFMTNPVEAALYIP